MAKARIIIVEDETIIAMELESSLQNLGYQVTSIVGTAEKALKKAEEDQPDLILMDIRIKGEMDGIDAAEVIRNRFGIPIIFCTAYLDQERIERAKITMPFGYLLKPIQERDLRVTLKMALYVAKVDAERRRAEKRSLENERQYRDLFDSMLDGFALHEMIFDEDGTPQDYRFLKVNPAFEKLTGLKAADILGKTVLEVLPDIEYDWIQRYGQVTVSGNPIRFENYTQELEKYYEVNAYRAQEGQFACIFKDITARKLTEEELVKSEKAHKEMLEGLNDAAYRMSLPDGKYEYFSQAAKSVFGFDSEEWKNNSLLISEIIHPQFVEYFNEKWADLIAGKVPKTYEYKIIDPEGNERWIFQSNTAIYDEENNIIAIEGLCRDITESKQVEARLKESEKRFQDLVLCSVDWIWEIDKSGEYTYVSEKIKNILGYDPEEIVGKTPFDLMPKKEAERIEIIFKETLSEKKPIVDLENWNLTKDGSEVCLLTNGIPIIDDEGNYLGYRGVDKDITLLKKTK